MSCPAQYQAFWCENENEGLVVGSLEHDTALIEALAERGTIVFWGRDPECRLVNTSWVTSPEAIKQVVMSEPKPGTCRFCGLDENPDELTELVSEPLRGLDTAHRLRLGVVHVHRQCAPYWQKWVEIVERGEVAA